MAEPTPLFRTANTRVSEIIECERQADNHDAIADEFRWKAAELIAKELADGKSQRQLAEQIGKSLTHVCYMNRAWHRSLEARQSLA